MRDEPPLGCCLSFLVCVLCCVVTGVIVRNINNHELIRRGLKEYNPRTGNIQWTEKAGGPHVVTPDDRNAKEGVAP